MFDSVHSPLTIHHRPRNRNTYISITRDGEVCVRTPLKNEHSIRRLLSQKEEWIRAKLHALSEKKVTPAVYGETIRFRGELYPITQLPNLEKLIKKSKNSIDIEKYYHRFYREEAVLTLPSRIEYYARKMGLNPSEVRFKKMKRRWGSCDSNKIVTFNTMMMQLSYEHIDYIIVHELAHLRHMNHSKAFHALVRSILENEGELRKALKAVQIH
ncbi:MAG: M48 family metallopeptidase [Sulfuricurvum sp.]|jgi:hypothetical protein|uniref:M48 family metallopeptidase n=1 Tax=Sulfuricurvum sp. TaxID=2025608 RepID=UPI0025D44263|nr:SprT family zinc-dependent metalloprotease [Sulfuricurvum sp.]MCK9372903.1 M48 family metallopeptidase [Sulfuricurvum sp.]